MESFCLACIATPVAFLINANMNKNININSLDLEKIEKNRKRQRLMMYMSIVFFIISTVFIIYMINRGCDECK